MTDATATTDTTDQDIDGRATCLHQDAVKWNPWNHVVQCHRCGQVFVPLAEVDQLREAHAAMTEVAAEHQRREWEAKAQNAAMREIVQAVAKSKPIINPHPQVIDVPVLFSISDDLVEIHEKARAFLADKTTN